MNFAQMNEYSRFYAEQGRQESDQQREVEAIMLEFDVTYDEALEKYEAETDINIP